MHRSDYALKELLSKLHASEVVLIVFTREIAPQTPLHGIAILLSSIVVDLYSRLFANS